MAAKDIGICGSAVNWILDENGTLKISGIGDMEETYTNAAEWRAMAPLITSVVVENGVTGISVRAFSDCLNLRSVQLADTVRRIGCCAFYRCSALTSIHLGSGLQVVSDYAFGGCDHLYGIFLPPGVTRIGIGAFEDCTALESINIPDAAVMHIDVFAFRNCPNLNSENFLEYERGCKRWVYC